MARSQLRKLEALRAKNRRTMFRNTSTAKLGVDVGVREYDTKVQNHLIDTGNSRAAVIKQTIKVHKVSTAKRVETPLSERHWLEPYKGSYRIAKPLSITPVKSKPKPLPSTQVLMGLHPLNKRTSTKRIEQWVKRNWRYYA